MASAARIRKNERDKKKKRKRKLILITVLCAFILFIGVFAVYVHNMFNQMDQVDIDDQDLGVNEPADDIIAASNVINIALFGIDTREGDYGKALSDTIMIASIDFDHKKIKLTSVMRDLYVNIPGEKYNRINNGYAVGGPVLAIKTLNTNFDLNITDFVTVNFEAMEKIVDAVGGVEIDVKSIEIDALNKNINEINIVTGTKFSFIKKSGLQTLNGRQAVAYSRIRYVGKADFERTERQRRVLEQVLNKVLKDRSITKAMRFADSLLPYVQTSMSRSEIVSIGTKVFTTGTSTLVNTRIPLDEHVKNASIKGASVLLPDTLLDNVTYLHNFIYENEEYEPSQRLLEINDDMPTK